MTPPSPEQMAKKVCPCWGDGLVGPKECDESFECELHSKIAAALREYGEACVNEFAEGHRTYTIRDIGEYRQAKAEARRSALEDLQDQLVLQGDVCERCITSLGDGIRALLKEELK